MAENQEYHKDECRKQNNTSKLSSNNSETISKHCGCHKKLPLFLFITVYVSFCCFGALCLNLLERPTERLERLRLHASQINFLKTNPCVSIEELQKFVSHIASATKMGISMTPVRNLSKYDALGIPKNWHENFYLKKNAEVNAQLEVIARRVLNEEEINKSSWNFFEAVFFVITVITTIGYGTVSPVTIYGKAFCIFLVTVGIPMNVVLVSVLASLCMPTIRKTRNALVNFYSHSRDHGTHYIEWKHQNSFAVNKHAKISGDEMCSSTKNEQTFSKLCFKLKFLFRKQVNDTVQQNESNGFRKQSSNSHLSNNIAKSSLHLTADNIVGQKNDIENEHLSNKTASLISLPTNRIPESSPPVEPVNIPKVSDSEKVSYNFPKHEQPTSIMKHHELQAYNDNPSNSLSASSTKTDRPATLPDHTDLPKKIRQGGVLNFNTKNHPDLTDNGTGQLNSTKSPPGQISEFNQNKAQNVCRPDPHLIGEPSKETTQSLWIINDCFSTETSLADRAHLSCIAFLHYLLSRSDLALTTQVKLSQFRYINVQHGIFRLRLVHFFIVFCIVMICSILIPAIIFSHLEHNWTYFDAIYFCIISLSAVGFGDMVASESKDTDVPSLVSILYVKNIYRIMTASEC
ncbi:hypothetical protein MN116_002194 [Schistosoma mekongi]|uniref:Potassium channel domain-containing protein n=1 Tax=Schistosoma mekongi TaxID=38744 RepID=A0AAE2D9I1_SCHME|nr:hypothetical protein MN116_002194 [Schistosoma mekongi]